MNEVPIQNKLKLRKLVDSKKFNKFMQNVQIQHNKNNNEDPLLCQSIQSIDVSKIKRRTNTKKRNMK